MTSNHSHFLSKINSLLNQSFNLEEFRNICFELSIDYDTVRGDEKSSKIREFILACARMGRIDELLELVKQLRPKVKWPSIPDNFELPAYLEYENALNKPNSITPHPPPLMALAPPADYVQRPNEYEQLVENILSNKKNTVAITATLKGAGGFGKTTLAQAICQDRRIRKAFPSGILWATIGDDGDNVLPSLSNVYEALSGQEAKFKDIHDATLQFSNLIAKHRCLIVIDDVWNVTHLKPFLQGGEQCVRLVTTRLSSVIPKSALIVNVDAMQYSEALTLLLSGIESNATKSIIPLANRLGEWPLLLKLVNRRLFEDVVRNQIPLTEAIAEVIKEFDELGLTSFDLDNSKERDQAVSVSIELSLKYLLKDAQYGQKNINEISRFIELAIFPEDTYIPVSTVAHYWQQTCDLPPKFTKKLCRRLADLALILRFDRKKRIILLHDVTRHYLKEQLTEEQIRFGHLSLVESYKIRCKGLWWNLEDDGYVYQNLIWHMSEANLQNELENLLFNYNWLNSKLQATDLNSLINDFNLRTDKTRNNLLGMLQHALQLSVSILTQDKSQLISQLNGRLANLGEGWKLLLDECLNQKQISWIKSKKAGLTPPGGNLLYSLEDHKHGVSNLLLTQDKRLITSTNHYKDTNIKIWDLETGSLLHSLEGHKHGVSNLLLAPDGRLISSCKYEDTTIMIWDIETGSLLHSIKSDDSIDNFFDETDKRFFEDSGRQSPGVDILLLAPDGRLIFYNNFSTKIEVWNIETGNLLHSFNSHDSEVNALFLTQDGRLISNSRRSSNQTVKVWDIETGNLLLSFEGRLSEIDNSFLIKNNQLITSTNHYKNTKIKIWDLETGKLLHTLDNHKNSVSNILIAPNGRLITSNEHYRQDNAVKVWDIESGNLIHSLEGHRHGVSILLLTQDGRLITSTGNYTDSTIKVWNIETGILIHSLEDHRDKVDNLLLTPDGRLISSCSSISVDKTIKIWDIESGNLLHNLKGHMDGVDNLLLTQDGQLISSCNSSFDKTIKVWDIESGRLIHSFERHKYGVSNLLLTPNGQLISSCNSSFDKTIKVWDIEAEKQFHSSDEHRGGVDTLLLTHDGRLISSCGSNNQDKTIKVWDIESNNLLHTLKGHNDGVSNLLLTPKGRLISSCSSISIDKTIKVWDIESGNLIHSLEGHNDGVSNFIITPDGQLISSSMHSRFDTTIKIIDIDTGSLIYSLEGHDGGISNLLLTPDNSLISSCRRGSYSSGKPDTLIKVWDIKKGSLIHSLKGHNDGVSNLLLTPNGQLISSCIGSRLDTAIKVWDIKTGSLLHTLNGNHVGASNLLLTPDGRLISSCKYSRLDTAIKVWDIKTGSLLHTLNGNHVGASNLLLTPDGHLISSCSGTNQDMSIKVWNIETGNLLFSIEDFVVLANKIRLIPTTRMFLTTGGQHLNVWHWESGRNITKFTTDGLILSCEIKSDKTIIIGDSLGQVHFLELIEQE